MKIALIFAFSVALSKDIAVAAVEDTTLTEIEFTTGLPIVPDPPRLETTGAPPEIQTTANLDIVLPNEITTDEIPKQTTPEVEVTNQPEIVDPAEVPEFTTAVPELDLPESATEFNTPEPLITGSAEVIKIDTVKEKTELETTLVTTEVGNTTEALVKPNLLRDGIECDLRIEGLQGKKRWLWTSYPDLYYVVKVDEIELSNSKQEIKKNRLNAEWSFTLPNHFEGEEKIKIEFYDKDVWNKDDLIGSAEFESAKLNEEICDEKDDGDDADYYHSAENVLCDKMVKLDAGTSPYRKDDTKYLMACEEKWINV